MPHQVADEEGWDLPEVPPVHDGDPASHPRTAVDFASCPELKEEDLRTLADYMKSQNLPETHDADLVKFLHSCEYDVQRAKDCVKSFYTCRQNMPELFADWDVNLPNFRTLFDIILVGIVPRRTPENYRVVVCGLKHSDYTHYSFMDVSKTLLMVMESIFLTEPTVDGVVLIHDLEKSSFGHFLKIGLTLPKKLNSYMQYGLPLIQRDTHIINCSMFVEKGVNMIRRFVKSEDWEKMHLHRGDAPSTLHQLIPKYCLPSEFGGTMPSLYELHDQTVRRLEAFKEHFKMPGTAGEPSIVDP